MEKKALSGKWVILSYLLILLLVFISVFILTSCEPQPKPVVYNYVCGDGVCSADENGKCESDCSMKIEPQTVITTPANIVTQLRERQKDYYPEQKFNTTNTVVAEDQQIVSESFTNYLPEKGFRVANRYNLLSMNENINNLSYALNGLSLPDILRSSRLSSNTEAFGPRAGVYSQLFRLKSGRVVFGYDENSEIISTYLLYKEGEPIFEYLLSVQGGIFKFFEGEPVSLLGHDYILTDVSNTSIKLIGVSTPDVLLVRNQHGVWINDNQVSNNVLNASTGKDFIRIILVADEDIRILPGTELRSYLNKPELMLTNRLDIAYEGLTSVPDFNIFFDKSNDKYRLKFITNKNINYSLPLAYLSPLKMGGEDYSLAYKEGNSSSDYFVKKKDYFIISNNKEFNGLTNIIRLVNVEEENNLILFEDPAFEKFYVYFKGTPGTNATADLIVNNVLHKVYVGKNDSISVDLDGNGKISRDNVPIITAGNGILRINNDDSSRINITLTTPKQMRENSNADLKINLIITSSGITVDKKSMTMINDNSQDQDLLVGMNDYGALFMLKGHTDEDEQSGDDLTIRYPLTQRFADVIIKAYE